MKRNLSLLFLALSFSATSLTHAQEATIKQKLIGSWLYSGLEFSGAANDYDKDQAAQADKANKDLIITFEADGRYMIWNKQAGKKEPYATGIIELTKKGRHLKITSLEGDIETLDDKVLKLSAPDRPLMVFKKYKTE
jgi:hypothetical protein